jgi:hypothetical protein
MESVGVYIGAAILAVIVVVSLVRSGVFGKAKLPPFPEAGALPVAELSKYYDAGDAIAWERVRGWELNQAPPTLAAPATIDHLILTPRLLDFCTSKSGKLELSFNFLVGAIQRVDFDPNALPAGSGVPGQGLVTIYTPSGRTLAVATGAFAQALQNAVRNAAHAVAG